MRISDWSSDVCSSDLIVQRPGEAFRRRRDLNARLAVGTVVDDDANGLDRAALLQRRHAVQQPAEPFRPAIGGGAKRYTHRSDEHTSQLQSLMRISYAVFCLKTTIITTSLCYTTST